MLHEVPTRFNLNATSSAVVFPVMRATFASVVARPHVSWSTAVLTPKWGNDQSGPFFAFASGELSDTTLGPGLDAISWINVTGKAYLAIEVTTAEGAEELCDIMVCDDAPEPRR